MKETIMILVLFTLLLSACDTQEPQAAVTSLDSTEAAQATKDATIPGTSLTIDLGPATTAACEDGLRGEEFLQLRSTAFYFQAIDNQLAVLSGYDPDSFRFTVLTLEEA